MKQCPQCQQTYSDDTNFCLTDGATLVPVSGSYISQSDMPTVVREVAPTVFSPAPPPTSFGQAQPPPSYSGTPFIPPVSSAPPEKSKTLLIAAIVGLIALVIGGAIVGLVMYGVFKTDKKDTNVANTSSSPEKTTQGGSADRKDDKDEVAENLKQQQEKLDKDKQKLEDERKALEAKKKQAAQTPPPSGTTAVIIDPPSNIRAAPNGAVICIARQRGTVINILGSTGVYDNNGVWYYTDYCGRQGVIHSSQIRF